MNDKIKAANAAGGKKRVICVPFELHKKIFLENSDSNQTRSKEEQLDTTGEMLQLIEDGLKYREQVRKGAISPHNKA